MGKHRYWSRVLRRALREALGVAKMDRPGPAIWSAVTIFAPAGLLFLATHDASALARAGATVGGVALGILCVFAWHLIAVPPLMDSEATEREESLTKTLASYEPQEEDADIRDGLGWIVLGEWGGSPEWDGGGRLEEFRLALVEVRNKAFRRKVSIWGRGPGAETLHEEISPDFFRSAGFDYESVLSDNGVPQTDAAPSVVKTRYRALMVNRAQFEREWPR